MFSARPRRHLKDVSILREPPQDNRTDGFWHEMYLWPRGKGVGTEGPERPFGSEPLCSRRCGTQVRDSILWAVVWQMDTHGANSDFHSPRIWIARFPPVQQFCLQSPRESSLLNMQSTNLLQHPIMHRFSVRRRFWKGDALVRRQTGR